MCLALGAAFKKHKIQQHKIVTIKRCDVCRRRAYDGLTVLTDHERRPTETPNASSAAEGGMGVWV